MTNREKVDHDIDILFASLKKLSAEKFAESITLEGSFFEGYRRCIRFIGYDGDWDDEERLTAWLKEEYQRTVM